MPRKPGGKYKGKIGRAKGESTIAAELEAKRRKQYEANLARLQERRQAELLAEAGLQNEEEEAQEMKLARIAQMFGSGKKGLTKKFFKNWKIGLVQIRKDRAIEERKTCWRKSCGFCDDLPPKAVHKHGLYNLVHTMTCKSWWTTNLGRTQWGEELHPAAAAKDRPDVVNDYRQCACCGVDTGYTGLGCRCWHRLQDNTFMGASEIMNTHRMKAAQHVQFQLPATLQKSLMAHSMSAPTLRKHTPSRTLSVDGNWGQLRADSIYNNMMSNEPGEPLQALEYDPSVPFTLSDAQAQLEERRAWSDALNAMSGSPWTRKRGGQVHLPTLPAPPLAPEYTERGKPLEEVTHWRTGQFTLLDKHAMKMYVHGLQ